LIVGASGTSAILVKGSLILEARFCFVLDNLTPWY